MKTNKLLLAIVFVLLFGFGQAVFANSININIQEDEQPVEIQRDALFQQLQATFQAQKSLADEHRSLSGVMNVLDEFLTEEYTGKFISENIYHEDEGYILLGSDVFAYFVPFFSYDENTMVVRKGNELIVYEFFKANNDGPVVWDDHYEGLVLTQTDSGWKVKKYTWGETEAKLLENAEKVHEDQVL